MKKITLALTLLTFGLNAQTFPSPYCDIDDAGTTVEEITSIDFAGITITNMDSSSILIDKTETVAEILTEETYSLVVSGNTVGDFDNDIVAFIDWNNNEILDDTGEIYEIGTLTNSNGTDGVSVSMDITVPSGFALGSTRIRITKIFQDEDSPAEVDPCAISFNPFGQGVFPGFGQALDFTLNTSTLGVDAFDVSALNIYPVPTNDILNIEYKSEMSAVKVYNLLGQEVYSQNTLASNVELDLSTLNSGTYLVKLFVAAESHTLRIVKQ